jgi:two-component system response regulator FimZ (fimbrial Z protein)/two-component system response regulator EvgA
MLVKTMLVDDHPTMIMALKSIMSSLITFEVIETASNGTSCLMLCNLLNPDLVILDLDMPDMDGFDVIRRLRAKHPNIRILIFTSLDEKTYGNRVRAIGAHGYLNKSVSPKVFISACTSVAQGFCFYSITSMDIHRIEINQQLQALSQREFQVLKHLGKGLGNHEISDTLNISHKTVSTYKMRVFEKLGIDNMADLICYCRENKVCD